MLTQRKIIVLSSILKKILNFYVLLVALSYIDCFTRAIPETEFSIYNIFFL